MKQAKLESEATERRLDAGGKPASRDNAVDILRGIAILLVVFGHANRGAIRDQLATSVNLPLVDFVIYAFHMPVFFYLAGFFTAVTLDRQPARDFAFSRLPRIAWPYVLWSVIYFLAGLVMSRVTTVNDPVRFGDLLAIGWQPLSTLWFLYALLVMQLLAALLHRQAALLFAVSVAASAIFSLTGHIGTQGIVERMVVHAPFFFAGHFAARYRSLPLFWTGSIVAALAGIVVFVAGLSGLYASGVTVPVQITTLPLAVIAILALGALSLWLARGRSLVGRILAEAGRASLGIYLLHTLFLAVAPRLLKVAHADFAWSRLLVGTSIGAGLSYAAFKIAQRLRLAGLLGLR